MSEQFPTLPTSRAGARTASRRAVVIGAGAGLAAMTVSGCAGGGTGSADTTAAPAGTALGPTSAVPVGSAAIFDAQGVVLTQATAGKFAAFSTVCPHQGCAVSKVEGTAIICPCHGSNFALDGSVVTGPAKSGLAARAVTVAGDELMLG